MEEEIVSKDSFDEIEKLIRARNPRQIRLCPLIRKRKENLEEFLIKFFDVFNEELDTIYTDNRSVQTPAGKRRSLGDIYQICRYYYSDCTLKEVINLLYNVLPSSMEEGFRNSYCGETKKRMWYFDPHDETEFLNNDKLDEFGKIAAFYRKNLKEDK